MQETSVKNSLRNFGEVKSNKNNIISASDASNVTLQLTRIGKMLDESVLKFTKRYLIIQTELEEMKREFVGDVSLISEYLNLTKKEIRYDKFDNAILGKFGNPINIPKLPNYEQKILRQDKKPNRYNNINNSVNYKKNLNTHTSLRTGNSTSRKNKTNKIISPQQKKKRINKEEISDKNVIKNLDLNGYNNNSNLVTSPNHKKNQYSIENSKQSIEDYKNRKEESLEKEEKKKKILKSLPDNKSKAIFISLNSDVVPYTEKLKLLNLNKEISSQVSTNDIYNDELVNIYNKINLLRQQPIEDDEKAILDKISIYPSKTAKTGLNFLNKQKENELMNDEIEINKKLLEMIYISCGDQLKDNQTLKDSYQQLFKKYNVDSIKELFFSYIYPRCYEDSLNGKLEIKEIESIINIIYQNKMLISDNLVTNNNKTFSYVAFSLDEICEYLIGIKDLDEDLKEKLKTEIEIKELMEKEQKIKNLMKI